MLKGDLNSFQLIELKTILSACRSISSKRITERDIITLRSLLNSLPLFSHMTLTNAFPKVERLTINRKVVGSNQRIKEISKLKYPPEEYVENYGRCNLKNQSVLYSTFNRLTALKEMKPQIGDLVTRTTWECPEDRELTICPIFKKQPPNKDIINLNTFDINQMYEREIRSEPKGLAEGIDLLMEFATDEFTKSVDSNNPNNYFISAYLADRMYTELQDGKVDAIYYPSVQEKLSFENLAIKKTSFDSYYKLTKASESVFISFSRGEKIGMNLKGIASTEDIDEDNNLVKWKENEFTQSDEEMSEMIEQYNLTFD